MPWSFSTRRSTVGYLDAGVPPERGEKISLKWCAEYELHTTTESELPSLSVLYHRDLLGLRVNNRHKHRSVIQ